MAIPKCLRILPFFVACSNSSKCFQFDPLTFQMWMLWRKYFLSVRDAELQVKSRGGRKNMTDTAEDEFGVQPFAGGLIPHLPQNRSGEIVS